MKLEPYQEKAVDWLFRKHKAQIVAVPGAGKTLIAAGALDRVIRSRKRTKRVLVGWLCNTLEQCQQAQTALNSFASIHLLADCRIQCAASETDWSDRDVLIVDENHHGTSASWRRQIETARGVLWGFTATPETGDPERDAALRELFGEQYVVDRAEVSKSRLVPARVILLDASDNCGGAIDQAIQEYFDRFKNRWRVDEVRELKAKIESARRAGEQAPLSEERLGEIMGQLKSIASWQGVTSVGITGNKARTDAGINAAVKHIRQGDQVLILVNHTGHGEEIARGLSMRGAKVALAHSKMGAKKRREALQAFRERRISCLIATSLADEGLDLPSINVLVLISGGRSRIKAEQRTGRALRAFAGKTEAIIYDFKDLQHPLMKRHAEARQALYRELGYQIAVSPSCHCAGQAV